MAILFHRYFAFFLLVLLSGLFFSISVPVYAATTVTDAYAQPTNLVVSEASNHKIVFTTPGGVAEGETVTLTFPSAWTTSSITEDDIDVDDDGVDLTTAANCTGSEEASVAISSGVITVTLCAGDGGAIAATSVVTVEIGTNAAASGTGSNQITNPTNAATYSIDVAGTFGEIGSIWIPILSDDDAGVTATVPAAVGGGGGGGGGGSGERSSVEVVDPNGGEELTGGESYEIEWSSTGTDAYVNIYYSTDKGGSYTSIVAAETNDGFYLWSVPEEETDEAYIKIELTDLASISDTDRSDAVFSIVLEEASEEVTEGDAEDTEEDPSPDADTEEDAGGDTEDEEESEEEDATEVIEEKAPKVEVPVTEDAEPEEESAEDEPGEEPEDEPVREVTTEFSTPDRSIDLDPDGRVVDAFGNSQTRVIVELDDEDLVDTARVILGDESFPLTQLSDGSFTVTLPVGVSEEALTVIADYIDGDTVTDTYRLDPQPYGFVFEYVESKEVAVPDASALVYRVIGGTLTQWDASFYGQRNPVVVGESGVIGWYVPDGDYVVVVQKEGYADGRIELSVSNNLLAPRIEMEPAEVCEPLISLACLRGDARIQLAAKIGSILATLTVVGGTIILASSFNLWNFLRFLVTQPFLLFARRKRKQFGVVYNAATKAPIDLAIVRLYNEAGKLVRTMVTDDQGRYFFKVEPGRYSMKATKDGFVFPSQFVLGKKQDGSYLDVYTKGLIEVNAQEVIIAANIPIDPEEAWSHHSPRTVVWHRFLRVFQHVIAISGVILSLSIAIFFPGILNWSLFAGQVALYLLTLRLARPKKPAGWGIVRDTTNKKPLANTVVRLFEPKFNKLIETTVTDRKGRYAFMVGQSRYFVTYEKPGYSKTELNPIDYRKKAELTPIAVDMNLSKTV
jgi:hypothetical protein